MSTDPSNLPKPNPPRNSATTCSSQPPAIRQVAASMEPVKEPNTSSSMKKLCVDAPVDEIVTKILVENVDYVRTAILEDLFGLPPDAS